MSSVRLESVRKVFGSTVAVDGVEFDAAFSCDCSATGYAGENCEIKGEPAAATDTTDSTMAAAGPPASGPP